MKILINFALTFCFFISVSAFADGSPEELRFYRELTLKIRPEATFKIPMLDRDLLFDYKLEAGNPIYPQPMVADTKLRNDPKKFYRMFWDRIFVKDGSRIVLNGQEVPLTCIFIIGQDNRFSGLKDPRFPQFIMKVYLVANDFTCTGPLNPGFPQNGGKEQAWDTYIYYEIKDPTIMLPVEAKLRYRWNESSAVLVR
jgi:hypothetical protein